MNASNFHHPLITSPKTMRQSALYSAKTRASREPQAKEAQATSVASDSPLGAESKLSKQMITTVTLPYQPFSQRSAPIAQLCNVPSKKVSTLLQVSEQHLLVEGDCGFTCVLCVDTAGGADHDSFSCAKPDITLYEDDLDLSQ